MFKSAFAVRRVWHITIPSFKTFTIKNSLLHPLFPYAPLLPATGQEGRQAAQYHASKHHSPLTRTHYSSGEMTLGKGTPASEILALLLVIFIDLEMFRSDRSEGNYLPRRPNRTEWARSAAYSVAVTSHSFTTLKFRIYVASTGECSIFNRMPIWVHEATVNI